MMVARIEGRGQMSLPPVLTALHEAVGAGAEREAMDRSWPALQGLILGKPLALMVDPPLAR